MRVPDDMRYHILERDKFRCRVCGGAAGRSRELRIDHYNPHSEVGEYLDSDNLWTLCHPCNSGKRDDAPTPGWVEITVTHEDQSYEVFFRDTALHQAHPFVDDLIDAMVEGEVVED